MKSRNLEIRDLVFGAILMAMIVLFSLLYVLGVSGFAAFTIAHVPVLIGAMVLGKKYGALLGAIFGLASFVLAFFTLAQNAPFTNPLLSVLPRIFFGWIIGYVYDFFHKLVKNRSVAIGITMGVSTLIHTLIVVPLLYLVVKTGFYFTASENPMTINLNLFPFIFAVFTSNAIVEIIIAIVVGTPTILVLDKLMNKNVN